MINIHSQENILNDDLTSFTRNQTHNISQIIIEKQLLQKQVTFLKSKLQSLAIKHPINLSNQTTRNKAINFPNQTNHFEANNQKQSHKNGKTTKSLFINQQLLQHSEREIDKNKTQTKTIEKQPIQRFRVGRIVKNINTKYQHFKPYQTIQLNNLENKPNLWFSNNKILNTNSSNLFSSRISKSPKSTIQHCPSSRLKIKRQNITDFQQQNFPLNKPHSRSQHNRNQSAFFSIGTKEISTNSSNKKFTENWRLRSRLMNRDKSLQSNIEKGCSSEYSSHGKILKNYAYFDMKSSNLIDSINSQHELISKSQIPNPIFSLSSFPYFIDKPHQKNNKQEIISLTIRIAKKFNISELKSENLQQIVIKKYKNCLIFKLPQTNKKIIWYFEGKFYFGEGQKQADQGYKSGEAIQYVPSKSYFKGQFLQNKKHGKGIMIGFNGNIYEGQWLQGHYHGHGKFFDNQSKQIYEGQFKKGRFDGFGILKISQNEVYKGEFVKGEKDGFGVQLLKNRDKFSGYYKKGRFHGNGRYIWSNGSFYQGQFKDGLRTGEGRWFSSFLNDRESYVGMYLDDKKHGFGRYKWGEGSVYEGQFQCDKKHGKGMIIYKDNKRIRGRWQNNRLVELQECLSLNLGSQTEYIENIKVELHENMKSTMID